jgi:hypothetical protein
MLPNSRYYIQFLRLLVEIFESLEVHEVLFFVCRLREGDGHMFSGNLFVEIVFDLDEGSFSRAEEIKHIDLRSSRLVQWWSTRAFHPRKTPGASRHHPFFLGTNSC